MFLFLLLCFVLLSLVSFVLFVMMYWTYKDATKRGMDSPGLWAIIVLFGNLVGFILYLIVRE